MVSLNEIMSPGLFDISCFEETTQDKSSWMDNPYFQLFTQQLGLKEIRDGDEYLLTPVKGRGWAVGFEEVTAAMEQLHAGLKATPEKTLDALNFVIDKLDGTKALPLYVVSFICRDVVNRVVLQRFNETIGCVCTNMTDLQNKIGDNIVEANETFNTLRFCDPAMGSGRFLTALTNEIIAVKSQLGILTDCDDNPLFGYKVVVAGRNLAAFDKRQFGQFAFEPSNPETKRIHDTFLKEKKIIIGKCLYGAEYDPISVMVCRLRFWSELLKHTCRHGKLSFTGAYVDSNICCGDALISRFAINEDLRSAFKQIGYSVGDYKNLVKDCRKARTRQEKEDLKRIIALIKNKIQHEIVWDDKHNDDLRRWQHELEMLKSPNLFTPDAEAEKAISARIIEARNMVDKYKQKAAEINSNPIYKRAVEWRYEFPDMLSETGDFIGFDAIIGNPPDTQGEQLTSSIVYKQLNYKAFKQTGEVSSLFYELGDKLLKPNYFMSYIASSSWMHAIPAGNLRQFMMEESNPLLMLEFDTSNRIDASLGGKGVLTLQKSHNQYRLMVCKIDSRFDPRMITLDDYIDRNAVISQVSGSGQTANAGFGIISETEKSIKNKISLAGVPLRTWDIRMHPGIKTGLDAAFIIDDKTKDQFVHADYKNFDIIKPLLSVDCIARYSPRKFEQWLLCIPWHFPLLFDQSITRASERAEERFAQQYPVIFEYLLRFKDRLIARDSAEVGVTFEWYALQQLSMNDEWDDFTQQKIIWRKESPSPDFCFDYGGCATLEPTCFIIGQHLKYLLGILNSKIGRFMLKDSPRVDNTGNIQISILTLEALKIPTPNIKIESDLIALVNKRTSDANPEECAELDHRINQIVYEIFGLNAEEIEFIEKQIII
ncbi:MAG: hypothetical protein LBR50_06595 [Tannerella sp.]|nr:hypothetical protein [Tannerella sp.]